jgi:hypothetical protein
VHLCGGPHTAAPKCCERGDCCPSSSPVEREAGHREGGGAHGRGLSPQLLRGRGAATAAAAGLLRGRNTPMQSAVSSPQPCCRARGGFRRGGKGQLKGRPPGWDCVGLPWLPGRGLMRGPVGAAQPVQIAPVRKPRYAGGEPADGSAVQTHALATGFVCSGVGKRRSEPGSRTPGGAAAQQPPDQQPWGTHCSSDWLRCCQTGNSSRLHPLWISLSWRCAAPAWQCSQTTTHARHVCLRPRALCAALAVQQPTRPPGLAACNAHAGAHL